MDTGDGESMKDPTVETPLERAELSRREWLKVVGAAGAVRAVSGATSAADAMAAATAPDVARAAPLEALPLPSTSDVLVPPRGRAFMKFSFDFPEPSVAFGGLRFGFLIFTDENTYGLDAPRVTADESGDTMRLTCSGFVWAGGQEKAPGSLTATFRRSGSAIEGDAVVEMRHPVKAVATIIRP